jgi:hypothetical protein
MGLPGADRAQPELWCCAYIIVALCVQAGSVCGPYLGNAGGLVLSSHVALRLVPCLLLRTGCCAQPLAAEQL